MSSSSSWVTNPDMSRAVDDRQDKSLSSAIFAEDSPLDSQDLLEALTASKIELIREEDVHIETEIGRGHTMTCYRGRWKDRDVAFKYVRYAC